MNKNLCFCIENKNLYLEQVLVEYMDIPIFFLCKNCNQYYIALCIDADELNYIIVQVSSSNIYNLLHGKLPMRNVILNQCEYWEVHSGEDVSLDIVTKHFMDELDVSFMPEEKAYFKILTEEIKVFVKNFDIEYFNMKYFKDSGKKADFNEASADDVLDILDVSMEEFTEKGEYSIKALLSKQKVFESILNDTYITCKSKEIAIAHNMNQSGRWSTSESSNIAA